MFANLIFFYCSFSIFDGLEDITIALKNRKVCLLVTKNSHTLLLYICATYLTFLLFLGISECLFEIVLMTTHRRNSRSPFFRTGYPSRWKKNVVAKRRNNDGISAGFTRKTSKAMARTNRQVRDRSWDINRL